MERLVEVGLSNALMAGALAVFAAMVGLICRRPALVHALWLLVLIKLVTPPLVPLPLGWLTAGAQPPPPANPPEQRAEAVLPLPKPDGAAVGDVPEAAAVAPGVEAAVELLVPLIDLAPEEKARPVPPREAAEGPDPVPARWRWPLGLGVVWLVCSAVWFFVATRRLIRFQRLLRHAQPAPEKLRQQARVPNGLDSGDGAGFIGNEDVTGPALLRGVGGRHE